MRRTEHVMLMYFWVSLPPSTRSVLGMQPRDLCILGSITTPALCAAMVDSVEILLASACLHLMKSKWKAPLWSVTVASHSAAATVYSSIYTQWSRVDKTWLLVAKRVGSVLAK